MKRELWLRLRRYRFGDLVPAHLVDCVSAMFGETDASTHAFAGKLVRKQGWTRPFALRAISRHFDHHPELIPEREQTDVFQAQYAATLALYRAEFNTTPPPDVWGTPKFGRVDGAAQAPPSQRRRDEMTIALPPSDDVPLYVYFEGTVSGDDSTVMAEFGGGGGFSGRGGGSDWTSDSASDSGSGDGGGAGDGGGSGCSSSCGGE